jgi:hypothetical protein
MADGGSKPPRLKTNDRIRGPDFQMGSLRDIFMATTPNIMLDHTYHPGMMTARRVYRTGHMDFKALKPALSGELPYTPG